MSLAKRLRKVETSLTPKQAVLLWLKEEQKLGFIERVDKLLKSPAHELPRARITELVGKTVRENLSKQGMNPKLSMQAEREARKRTDVLIVLVRDLQRDVHLVCTLNAPYVVLLFEKLKRMLEHFTEHERFDATSWQLWRAILTQRLSEMWLYREAITEISQRYFDHHPLLFPEDAHRFDLQIQGLEQLVQHYNSLEGGLPEWTAIDSDGIVSFIREQVLAEVEERLANAKSTTLEDFGEREAAWKLREPYVLAMLKRLRATEINATGGD